MTIARPATAYRQSPYRGRVTSAAEFVQLSMSCTASGWFLGVGAFIALGAISGIASGEGIFGEEIDHLAGCLGIALVLIAGCALAGVGINSFLDGCH
ncbi:hypothetical protein [Kitasatospora sp. NPDC058218]|uniref:hypothetical protein n=1 Tax=Kitasatospora sp. NPDC058218 TaxID=3346385 RepID=UPI0036DA0A3E